MSEVLNTIANWVFFYRRELASSIAAVIACGAAAYLIASVLGRLDRGGRGRDAVGSRLAWVAGLLVVTLAAATNAAMLFARAGGTTTGAGATGVLARVGMALHPADYAYMSAILTLALGFGLWAYRRRRRRPERVGNPDTSKLMFFAGSVLFIALWIFQRGVDPFAVNPKEITGLQLFGTIVGAGLLAMAIVQGLRTLLPLRGVYHRISLERWIDDAMPAAVSRRKRTRRIRRAVTRLARGPALADKYSLLDLPIEQLCGQIAAGADRLLDAPFSATLASGSRQSAATPAEVLTALAAGGGKEIDRYLQLAERIVPQPSAEAVPPASVRSAPPAMAASPQGEAFDAQGKTSKSAPFDAGAEEFMRLRTNISQRIQRHIDGLQIAAAFWWRRVVRSVAFTVSGILGLSIFSGSITYSLMCAIVGGFVATVSRDLVAIVEKARR